MRGKILQLNGRNSLDEIKEPLGINSYQRKVSVKIRQIAMGTLNGAEFRQKSTRNFSLICTEQRQSGSLPVFLASSSRVPREFLASSLMGALARRDPQTEKKKCQIQIGEN